MLLWLTGPVGSSGDRTMLVAQNAATPRSASIELVTNPSQHDYSGYDAVVRRDGHVTWNSHNADLRIAVVAPNGEALRDQKMGLLRALGEAQQQGLNLSDVALDAGSDDRVTPGLPRAANDLRSLLEQKRLIR